MTNYAPQLSRKQFNNLCDEHGVRAKDRPALAGLVYNGKPVGKALHAKVDGRWRRSRKNGEYARFMATIQQTLSAHCEHKFPPPDYQIPEGYELYDNRCNLRS